MSGKRAIVLVLACLIAGTLAPSVGAGSFLFDATRREMAGNADWVVNADAHDLSMPAYPCSGSTLESNPARIPTPPQSGVTATTAETYWTGAVSAWAIELVKAGHTVEQLPPGGAITYGDVTNPQDLAQYGVFVLVEPQNPFSSQEKAAILSFVQAGGGLFLVGDHETSDRDCDGWDSPHVLNDLMGATSAASTGLFGIWFRVDGSDASPSEDWFSDPVDANASTDPADPIVHGPFGSGAGGLGLFGSTSMELNTSDNPTVAAHVWRSGQPHDLSRVTFATAGYGSGRIAAIGDSSPADDGTGDSSDSLHPGWDRASGGVANREIHLNACAWLLDAIPDTTQPAITSGPDALPGDCSARISWTTDEPATSSVEFGPTESYGSTATAPGLVRIHAVELSGLTPGTTYHHRVASTDAAGNGPTASADAVLTTLAAAPPVITAPMVSAASGRSAIVTWTTDEPATSVVEYGTTAVYDSSASTAGLVRDHAVSLGGLTPLTLYHYRLLSSDGCGNGPTATDDATFTTGPDALDLGGWTLKQYGSTQSITFPPGTSIPSAGYLVVARDANRAEFEAAFPSLPPATVFVDSNASGSCANGCIPQVNGGETYELYDAGNVLRDGMTITIGQNSAYQRTRPQDPPASSGSWTVVPEASANPGQGAGPGNGAGVVINEMADAADYRKEYVELYYDAGSAQPDSVPPAAVTDLRATPVSSTSIRLDWTATGDDGSTGTATSYDVRLSPRRILSEADFAAAAQVAGEPAPHAPGTAEQMNVNGLSTDAPAYFAMKVLDEQTNASPLSGDAWAVTAPAGGASPVNHLVISQIRVSGSTDDVIELHNPTAAAIPLASTSVQYLAANGNFGFRVNLNGASDVPSHGYYLVAGSGYSGSPSKDDNLGSSNLSASAGHALLVSKTTNVSGCADAAIVDRVGYGASASCPEGGAGHAATTPGAGLTIVRKPGGSSGHGQDTDQNDADFLAPGSPVFHDRASAPATPPSALGNVRTTLYLSRGAGTADLRWGNAAGATGYRVYRGTTAGFMSSSPAPWTTTVGSATSDAEIPSSILYYVVRATDGSAESED